MFIADAHCDTLYKLAVDQIPLEACMVTPRRMQAGGVGLQTLAMFAGGKGCEGTPYADAVRMMEAAKALPFRVFTGRLPDEPPKEPAGVLSIDGGEVLEGSIQRLEEFYHAGRIRMIALTWNNENEIAHPAAQNDEEGLKPFGFELLREMDRRGILADVSHLNLRGFWDVVEHAQLPPVASHSNLRTLCDHRRNLYQEQVKAIIERGGFIGINFYSDFLIQGRPAVLEDVWRHIDGIAQLGGVQVLGFGSDFDGIDAWPEGLASPADFPSLIELMRKHGYPEQAIADIAGLNLWRLMKRAEAGVTVGK